MRNITLVVLVIVSVCFGSPSIVVNGESIELTEVGEELATKAAEVYLEELYPDSPATMGPAGPVYSLQTLDDSIAGWFFVVDQKGEQNLSVNEMQDIAVFYEHKHYEHYLQGDNSFKPEVTTGYREAMERYEGIFISNYQEYSPLLYHYRYIPFSSIEARRYELDSPEKYSSQVRLYGTPGSQRITLRFSAKDDGSRAYSPHANRYLSYSENELLNHPNLLRASPRSEHSIRESQHAWEKIEQLPATESN